MLGASYGTVTDFEVVWTLINLGAAAFCLLNLRESLSDYRFIKAKQISNGRRAIAISAFVNESLRLFILSIFTAVGALVMFLPDPPVQAHIPLFQQIISAVVRWGLLASAVAIAGQTYSVRRVRKEVGKKPPKYTP